MHFIKTSILTILKGLGSKYHNRKEKFSRFIRLQLGKFPQKQDKMSRRWKIGEKT